MTELLTGFAATLAMAKSVLEIGKTLNNVELIKQNSDLIFQIAQNQIEAANLINENQELKTEIEEMKNNPLRFDGSMYRDNDNFPFCPACYDSRKIKVHLKMPYKTVTGNMCFKCPVCDVGFYEK